MRVSIPFLIARIHSYEDVQTMFCCEHTQEELPCSLSICLSLRHLDALKDAVI